MTHNSIMLALALLFTALSSPQSKRPSLKPELFSHVDSVDVGKLLNHPSSDALSFTLSADGKQLYLYDQGTLYCYNIYQKKLEYRKKLGLPKRHTCLLSSKDHIGILQSWQEGQSNYLQIYQILAESEFQDRGIYQSSTDDFQGSCDLKFFGQDSSALWLSGYQKQYRCVGTQALKDSSCRDLYSGYQYRKEYTPENTFLLAGADTLFNPSLFEMEFPKLERMTIYNKVVWFKDPNKNYFFQYRLFSNELFLNHFDSNYLLPFLYGFYAPVPVNGKIYIFYL